MPPDALAPLGVAAADADPDVVDAVALAAAAAAPDGADGEGPPPLDFVPETRAAVLGFRGGMPPTDAAVCWRCRVP